VICLVLRRNRYIKEADDPIAGEIASAFRCSDVNEMRCLLLNLAVILLPGTVPAGEIEEAVQLALDEVAKQTEIDRGSIKVDGTESVDWADSNLGCPTGAAVSTPQITRGYRVLLRANGKLYAVHVGGSKAVICSRGLAVASALQEASTIPGNVQPEPSDAPSRALISKARADLARRLAVAPDKVLFVKFKSVVWPDSSLGCPRPGMAYTQVRHDGVLIRFEVNGRHYDYHGGATRDPFLCENPSASVPEQREK